MNVLPFEKQIRIIGALVEGCSIRAIERMTGVQRDTIMHLGVKAGEACHRLHDAHMRNLQVSTIELDEQWAFIGKKQKRACHSPSPKSNSGHPLPKPGHPGSK